MNESGQISKWVPGTAPVAVVMISLNEGHNMEAALQNLKGWAQQVFLVDSYSTDATIDIALKNGVHVVQRKFNGFGDQWNFALKFLPITASWTMKLDPDERISPELKLSILKAIEKNNSYGLTLDRKLYFMGKPLPIKQRILRLWRTGNCNFSNVLVNEYPIVNGRVDHVPGEMEHHDSPNLHHWYDKQNKYSTAEAKSSYDRHAMAEKPCVFGNSLQRRMWIKKNFSRIPFRFYLIYLYNLFWLGAWRAGAVGRIWANLRREVYRSREYKLKEMKIIGKSYEPPLDRSGLPDPRVQQCD